MAVSSGPLPIAKNAFTKIALPKTGGEHAGQETSTEDPSHGPAVDESHWRSALACRFLHRVKKSGKMREKGTLLPRERRPGAWDGADE